MPTRLPEKLATAALAWAATSLAVQLFLPDRRGYTARTTASRRALTAFRTVPRR